MPADGQSVVVMTTHGRLRGVRNGGLTLFKGVPYAGSPAGAGRFKAPPKLAPWAGVRDALVYGPQAMQPPDPGWPKEWARAASSEDCLVLNVWTPGTADGKRRPVMAHAMEIAFKFNHPETSPEAGRWPERFQAARNMSAAWAALARTGHPGHPGIPAWPAYDTERRATMVLDAECRVVDDPHRAERRLWQEVGGGFPRG